MLLKMRLFRFAHNDRKGVFFKKAFSRASFLRRQESSKLAKPQREILDSCLRRNDSVSDFFSKNVFGNSPLIVSLAFFLIFFSVTAYGATANNILDKDKKRVDAYKDKIKEKKNELKVVEGKEQSIFDDLRTIESLVEEKGAELRDIENKQDDIVINLNSNEKLIGVLEVKADIQRNQLKKRVVTLYRLSDTFYLKILFSTSSYIDILKRYKYLKLILNQDSKLIAKFISGQKELAEKTETLKKEKEMLDEITKKVENKEEEILAEKSSKEILLLKVKREKNYYLRAINELNESAKKLEGLIVKLQKSASNSKSSYKEDFNDFKKILAPPVKGSIISFFGKEYISRFNSYLFNNGIEFSAKSGQDVKAVFGGDVIYSDWFKGYCRVIILSHSGGYYTIYSHLSELLKKAGEQVNRSDTIAKSGDTGSLTGPCLYFEIRYKGRSIDPLEWLEPTVKKARSVQN